MTFVEELESFEQLSKSEFVEKRRNFLRTHYEKDFYRDETLSGKA